MGNNLRDKYAPQVGFTDNYANGRWYLSCDGISIAGSAPGANVPRGIPFQIRALVNIVQLGARVATLFAASHFRLAIYRANAVTLLPMGLPVASVSQDMDGSAAVNVAAPIDQGVAQLAPGLYWGFVWADSGTLAFATISAAQMTALAGGPDQASINAGATTNTAYRFLAATYGNPWPNLSDPAATSPNIGSATANIQFQVQP